MKEPLKGPLLQAQSPTPQLQRPLLEPLPRALPCCRSEAPNCPQDVRKCHRRAELPGYDQPQHEAEQGGIAAPQKWGWVVAAMLPVLHPQHLRGPRSVLLREQRAAVLS